MALQEITQGTAFWQPFRPHYRANTLSDITGNLEILEQKFVQMPDRSIYYVDENQEYHLMHDLFLRPIVAHQIYTPSGVLIGGLKFVSAKEDFPECESGVITLPDQTAWYITQNIDLLGCRIQGQGFTLLGPSSTTVVLSSTGLSDTTALITATKDVSIQNLQIDTGTALDCATVEAGTLFSVTACRFVTTVSIGTVSGYNNNLFFETSFSGGGITFDGTMSSIAYSDCVFIPASGKTAITIPATATITTRMRLQVSPFVVGTGATGLNVSTSASIPVEGYLLTRLNFSGAGTYLVGVQHTDNKSFFDSNRGIQNSSSIAYYTMTANATTTDITVTNTPVKVAGTTILQAISQRFTMPSNNRGTYGGAILRDFKVTAFASASAGNNDEMGMYIAKNGTVITASRARSTANASGKAEGITTQAVVSLAQNDYLEVFVENETAVQDITVTDLSVIIETLN